MVSEYEEQAAVCQYLNLRQLPFVHIANEGKRSQATGARLKAIGMQKGFPDLFIIVPNAEYHGLFIEMKTLKGRLTPEQRQWLELLNERGYKAVCCHGFWEARRTIDEYMGVK